MTFLLDRFTPTGSFRPRTVSDLFALRLAQKLDDVLAASHYAALAESHSECQLLSAYRKALRKTTNGDRGRQFHLELQRGNGNGHQDRGSKLISIRVERRTVAAAVFDGDHLEYTDSRQLSSVNEKALASAVGFTRWMLNRFPVETATLETIAIGYEVQRRLLHDGICETLREKLLPIWEIPKAALLDGCGGLPLKSRAQLREIATSIWPVIAGTNAKVFIQDAAILGLHVQIERLFIINN